MGADNSVILIMTELHFYDGTIGLSRCVNTKAKNVNFEPRHQFIILTTDSIRNSVVNWLVTKKTFYWVIEKNATVNYKIQNL